MPDTLVTIGYLVAGILFILSLGGLSRQETARRGNLFGILGMTLAIALTFVHVDELSWAWAGGAVAVGAVIGALAAGRVAMTSMPELVAILHSFVGLAAVLVGVATFLTPAAYASPAAALIHDIEIYVAVAIGAVTFTGSIVAWGKLKGTFSSAAFRMPGRHFINAMIVVDLVIAGVVFTQTADAQLALWLLLGCAGVSAVLGVHLVVAIGGADMPVVVSLLNSYSGWAAAAAGFMLSNDLLIITGALVGSSGAILSAIMCRGMNRSLVNVIFGGFGESAGAASGAAKEYGEATAANAGQVADLLRGAERVVIVPGYGMAVAQAQHAISELVRRLRKHGAEVLFGIHPVAGRMPGHMNVLLAEADIPYDIVLEMDEVNAVLGQTDAVLVVGANDIVNPDALTDESSPIAGMPQIEVWQADRVVVLKRSLSTGYAGVQNPLFFQDNTWMFFGDARDSVNALCEVLRN